MRHKTLGIALNSIKYRDTSLISRVYTEALGLQSYIINGVRSSKTKAGKAAFFQPLTLLDLVVYHKPQNQLNRLAEIRADYVYQHLHQDHRKALVAMYAAELLAKSLREDAPNPKLFTFLRSALIQLDTTQTNVANFPLFLTLALTHWLGFGAQDPASLADELDLSQLPPEAHPILAQALPQPQILLTKPLTNPIRRALLDLFLKLYRHHIEGFGELKSIPILRNLQQ